MPTLPKNPAVRQRTNRSASAAILPPEVSPISKPPKLPDLPGRRWEKLTRAWWKDIWQSPMAGEYLRVDLHGLYRLAVLVDDFWKAPSDKLAAEIRLQQQAYGISPYDRRRLEWFVVQAEDAAERLEEKRSKRALIIDNDGDPRDVFKDL